MLANKCDRCGSFYTNVETNGIYSIKRHNNNTKLDLCDSCYEKYLIEPGEGDADEK